MTHYDTVHPGLMRIQRIALIAGVVAAVLLAVGAILISSERFFQSYLFAYLFWIGLALGSMAVVMLQHLVGGGWGLIIRRPLEAAAMQVVLMALLFLPIAFGMHEIYEWTHTEEVLLDPILRQKQGYLNIPFFLIRALIYFGIWIALAYFLNKLSLKQDREYDPRRARRIRDISRGGLLLYGLTMTFASFDWAMSLEPHWFSSIYGLLFIVGQGLATMAFAVVVVLLLLMKREAVAPLVTPRIIHDLGNLMLAFVMLWAYISFSQFLIIWSGNLPEEVTWYFFRLEGGWGWIPALLIIFHFVLPFLLLLSRRTKRTPRLLLTVALLILTMRLVDIFWIVKPAFHHEGFDIHWMDILAPIGIGGIWIAAFTWILGRRPLVPIHDPRLEEIAHHE